ncbi:uncharacterized protein YbjT (DUF2867 family) [Mucilaginibacter sp. UYP25]|uniref:NAD-dependent epimerase/dehydratase family protein n=1 Tax=unclassified Mucilaginibacter TaxID=2617802 RepID=UPI0033923DCB
MAGKKLKVIITGATGMVGEGVMIQCLQHADVEAVLIINRKASGYNHPKLTEIVHTDFYNLMPIEDQLVGYDACYFCLGISSVGVSRDDYYKTTYMITLGVAQTLAALNTDMTFCYVSGAGTDSKEKGTGWAAVKGKTENDLMKLPFKQVFAFRPGFIKPIEGQTRVNKLFKFIAWMYPIGRSLYSGGFAQVREIAEAMIKVTRDGYAKPVIEGKDIIALGKTA